MSGQEESTAFAQNIQPFQKHYNLRSCFVCPFKVYFSSFEYYKCIMKCNNLYFHLNQYTAIKGIKINIPKENSVGLWSLMVFSFIQVTPFIFGIFFLLKGGVGCMSLFNLNFLKC